MIQFNLLPAVKLEYIKAQRTKRLVIVGSLMVAAFTLIIFIALLVNVNFVQKKHINNLTQDISNNVTELQKIENIDKVLTVQNQLNVLPTLHEQKPAANRALTFLSKLTPQAASISQTTISFDTSTITINGTTNSLVTVNKFVDTLKFTKYVVDDNGQETNAFSDVVLTSFSVDSEQASYQIDFKFQPDIFNHTKQIELVVPSIISTRSQTEKPTDLFQAPKNKNETNTPQ